jgi:hypothetical protein
MKLKYQYQSLRHLISSTLVSFGRTASSKKNSTIRVLPERLKDMINGLWTALLSIYATILGMTLTILLLLLSFLQIIYGIMDTFTTILLNISWTLESHTMATLKRISTLLK